MKSKKIFLVALTVMCAMAITSAFIACGKDDSNDVKTFSYHIGFGSITYSSTTTGSSTSSDGGLSTWMHSILNAYETALGVSSDSFSKTGKQAECDKQVFDACKRAEEKVNDIRGGSATIIITNVTAGNTVYTYNVQP